MGSAVLREDVPARWLVAVGLWLVAERRLEVRPRVTTWRAEAHHHWGPGPRPVGDGEPARASVPRAGSQHGGGPRLTAARLQKLEEQDRRALGIKEQLQREHHFLKRRLEQLSVQSLERVRTDSTGSAVSTDDSEQGGHRPPAAPRGRGAGQEAA